MFTYNEKRFFNPAPVEPTCPPPREPHSFPEKVEITSRMLRDTLDRLLMFEHTMKEKYDDLFSIMTNDNVTFKKLMEDAYSDFVSSVRTEINLFETNTSSVVTLFKEAINARLTEFNENYSQAFADYQKELSEYLNTFEDTIREEFNLYKNDVNNIIAQHVARFDAQDAKIDDAVAYMKSNLNATLENLLHEMREDGSLSGVIDSEIMTSVKVEGAAGDGVTDDTQAFIEAISNGTNIVVPEGTYKITSDLVFDKDYVNFNAENATLILEGASIKIQNQRSIFRFGAIRSNRDCIIIGGSNLVGYNYLRAHRAESTNGIALYLDGTVNGIQYMTIEGAYIGSDVSCKIVRNGSGWASQNNFNGCSFGAGSVASLYIEGCESGNVSYNTFIACAFEECKLGLYADYMSACSFIAPRFEELASGGLYAQISANCTENMFQLSRGRSSKAFVDKGSNTYPGSINPNGEYSGFMAKTLNGYMTVFGARRGKEYAISTSVDMRTSENFNTYGCMTDMDALFIDSQETSIDIHLNECYGYAMAHDIYIFVASTNAAAINLYWNGFSTPINPSRFVAGHAYKVSMIGQKSARSFAITEIDLITT